MNTNTISPPSDALRLYTARATQAVYEGQAQDAWIIYSPMMGSTVWTTEKDLLDLDGGHSVLWRFSTAHGTTPASLLSRDGLTLSLPFWAVYDGPARPRIAFVSGKITPRHARTGSGMAVYYDGRLGHYNHVYRFAAQNDDWTLLVSDEIMGVHPHAISGSRDWLMVYRLQLEIPRREYQDAMERLNTMLVPVGA